MERFRALLLNGTKFAQATSGKIRLYMVKVGAVIRRNTRKNIPCSFKHLSESGTVAPDRNKDHGHGIIIWRAVPRLQNNNGGKELLRSLRILFSLSTPNTIGLHVLSSLFLQ